VEEEVVAVVGVSFMRAVMLLDRARSREEGQAMVEYALLLFLIAVVSIVILGLLGTKVSEIFNQVVNDI
jgi:pilus assembly protein Flp/PilA